MLFLINKHLKMCNKINIISFFFDFNHNVRYVFGCPFNTYSFGLGRQSKLARIGQSSGSLTPDNLLRTTPWDGIHRHSPLDTAVLTAGSGVAPHHVPHRADVVRPGLLGPGPGAAGHPAAVAGRPRPAGVRRTGPFSSRRAPPWGLLDH